ncbi:ergosterol biosynthetic protein 28 isoform X1 [Elaeis guineensis]|uniref:ergosterol biosynthetic protein 28 isoform X1 n=1 Tax=Elaeis guineensis var. tenera TaxID=51953 RepID=UPI003C6DB0CC
MRALGLWLMLVGSLRVASVWFGFFDIWALRLAVFSQTQMTDVHGRTFGIWTLLTCTLCFLCAFNLENKPLYLATFLSFIYAFGHFLTEYLIYHTMAASNLITVGIFAGTSLSSFHHISYQFCVEIYKSISNTFYLFFSFHEMIKFCVS